jgi:hypothetical protein
MLDYKEYERVFNAGDDSVTFTGGTREHRGKPALKAFLDWAHDGVRRV